MFSKLAFPNVQRSMKDYLVYVLTMTAITSFMYSFSSLFFDTELLGTFEIFGVMQGVAGCATFFLVLQLEYCFNR